MEKIKEYKGIIILILVVLAIALSWYAYELKLDERKIIACSKFAQKHIGDSCDSEWYKCLERSDLFIKIKC